MPDQNLAPYIKDVQSPAVQVPPEDVLKKFTDLSNLIDKIGNDRSPSEQELHTLASDIIRAFPESLTKSLDPVNKASLKAHIFRILSEFFDQHPDANENQAKDLAFKLAQELLVHQTNSLSLKTSFHGDKVPPSRQETIIHDGRRLAVTLDSAAGWLTLVISSATSLFGGQHLGELVLDDLNSGPKGGLKDFLANLLHLNDPAYFDALSMGAGVATVAATTGALFKFKQRLHETAFGSSEDRGFLRAGVDIARQGIKKNPLTTILLASLLIYDVVSNADGVVTLTAGSADQHAQIEAARGTIVPVVDTMRGAIKDLPSHVKTNASQAVQALLDAESTGAAASGAAGKGPVYHAKTQLLLNEAGGRQGLSANTTAIATDLKGQLASGLGNDQIPGLPDHLELVVKSKTADIEKELNAINTLLQALDATDSTATNKQRLQLITEAFDRIQNILKSDGTLSTELGKVVVDYETVLSQLDAIAVEHYPSAKQSVLGEIKMPSVQVSIPEDIKIGGVEYKSAISLLKEHADKGEVALGLFYATLSLTIALLMSYGNEMLLSAPLRKAHRSAREDVADKDAKLKGLQKGLETLLDILLNRPYQKIGKTANVPPALIEHVITRSIDQRVEALRSGAPKRALQNLTGIPEVVLDHNDRAAAVGEMIFDQKTAVVILQNILMEIIPAWKRLNVNDDIADYDGIVNVADEHLNEQSLAVERREIAVLREGFSKPLQDDLPADPKKTSLLEKVHDLLRPSRIDKKSSSGNNPQPPLSLNTLLESRSVVSLRLDQVKKGLGFARGIIVALNTNVRPAGAEDREQLEGDVQDVINKLYIAGIREIDRSMGDFSRSMNEITTTQRCDQVLDSLEALKKSGVEVLTQLLNDMPELSKNGVPSQNVSSSLKPDIQAQLTPLGNKLDGLINDLTKRREEIVEAANAAKNSLNSLRS